MPELRVISGADRSVVGFGEARAELRAAAELRAEALAIEGWYGKNAYSDFLLRYCRRPNPGQAATMGRLMGVRLAASDGTLQPPLTPAERRALREERKRHRSDAALDAQVLRLCRAIAGLAENDAAPSELIEHVCPHLDEPVIREQLSRAVLWLSRFEEEWRRREKGRAD